MDKYPSLYYGSGINSTALLAAWSILSFTGVVTFIYSNF